MATSEAEARAALMRLRESEELVHYLTEGVGEQDAVEAMRSLLDQHARSLELGALFDRPPASSLRGSRPALPKH
jgi:tryptophan synthase alpha subunit